MNHKEDFKKATLAYIKNKDIIQKNFMGQLYSLELEKNELNDLFDKSASTDILLKSKDGLIYGIAMRVNFNKKWHKNITIRYKRITGTKTEFEKTISAIKSNAINSAIGVQIDVDESYNLIRGVIYDRYKLFKHINDNIDYFTKKHIHQVYDGNQMFYLNYDLLDEINIKNNVFENTLENLFT